MNRDTNATSPNDPNTFADCADWPVNSETAAAEELGARVDKLEAGAAAAPLDDVRLNAFAETMNGCFWETDADLRFTFVSPNVEMITGKTSEWYLGKTHAEVGSPSSVSEKEWRRHLERLEEFQPFSGILFERKVPGGTKWIRLNGRPYYNAKGQFAGYRGVAFDNTEKVVFEQRAVLLAGAIEQLDETFVLWGPDDRLISCNAKFREFNQRIAKSIEPGCLFEEYLRASLAEGLVSEAVGREDEWFRHRMSLHFDGSSKFEVERADGRWILVSEQLLPGGFIATTATDISERRKFEQTIAAKNRVLEAVMQAVPDGLIVLDKDLRLVICNDQLFDVLQLDKEAIVGEDNPGAAIRYTMAKRGDYGPGDIDALVKIRENYGETRKPHRYKRQLASGKWIECRAHPIEGAGYLVLYRDIDARKRAEDQMKLLATTDHLTGVANRRRFLEIAEQEFRRARRYNRPFSVVMLDVDQFKSVNDSYGHTVGDAALKKVAEICNDVIRESDRVGRFGGEEFVVLLPETSLVDANVLAERVRAALADAKVAYEDVLISITASLGVAVMTSVHRSIQDVIAEADAAMYAAKNAGRNRVISA